MYIAEFEPQQGLSREEYTLQRVNKVRRRLKKSGFGCEARLAKDSSLLQVWMEIVKRI